MRVVPIWYNSNMSWNKPSSEAPASPVKTGGGAWKRGLVAGLVVVLGAVCYFVFCTSSQESVKGTDEKKPMRIKEVRPAAAPKAEAVKDEKKESELSDREKRLKFYRDKYGDNIPDNLKPTVYYLEHPPKQTYNSPNPLSFLRHVSERQIAAFANTEPGTFMVVKTEFGEAFDQDFINALMDKIEINDDDTETVKATKENVTALKHEIAAICKQEGKKPSEVMTEHAASLYELGRYQRDLETELDKIHDNPNYTDQDVEDFCNAANKMLESKGLKPMPIPSLARRAFHLKRLERMAAEEAAEKGGEK